MADPRTVLPTLDATFSSIDSVVWDAVEPWAAVAITLEAYGDNYDLARALWTGHFLAVAGIVTGSGAGTGQVSSMSVGGVSVSYANAQQTGMGSEWLSSTKWGRLLVLLNSQYAGPHLFLT
jgi:hypothetical protein